MIMKRCLFAMFFLLFAGVAGFAKPQPLEIGAKAPSFELKGVDGKMHSLEDYRDANVLMVVFTCNHCPTAQAYEKRLKQIVTDYKDRGVAVVAISPNDPRALRPDELRYSDLNDTFEEMKIRAKKEKFNFPYLYDGDKQKVSKAYGPVATPHVFIFDEERTLRYQGRVDDNENPKKVNTKDTRRALNALLEGKEVPKKTTKVFGCSVKWSNKREQADRAKKELKQEKATLSTLDPEQLKTLVNKTDGTVRMFNIWATWCGPCQEEFPDLNEIHHFYRSRDFELYTISLDTMNKKDDVLNFLNKHDASMTNYIVPSEKRDQMGNILDPEWNGPVPHTVIYGSEGEVIYRKTGRFNPLTVKRAIVNELGRTYYE